MANEPIDEVPVTQPPQATSAQSPIDEVPIDEVPVQSASTSSAKPGVLDAVRGEMKPLTPTAPEVPQTGHPALDALSMLKNVLTAPSRLSSTVSNAAQGIGDAQAKALALLGVNPTLAKASGVAAGVALDPQTWVSMAPEAKAIQSGVEAAGSSVGPKAVKLMSKASGVPEQSFKTVYNNPSAILPESMGGAPSADTAKAVFKQALETEGIPSSRTVDQLTKATSLAKQTLKTIEDAGGKGEIPQVDPADLWRTRQWLDDKINTTMRSGDFQQMTDWIKQRNGVQALLDTSAPALQDASKVYAQYKQVAPFMNAFPIDKAGNPSLAKAAVMELLLSGGMAGRSIPKAAVASPIVQGAMTAAAGAGVRGAGTAGAALLNAMRQHILNGNK